MSDDRIFTPKEELRIYRRQALCAARGLRYSKEAKECIAKAETIDDICRIMITERHRVSNEEAERTRENYKASNGEL